MQVQVPPKKLIPILTLTFLISSLALNTVHAQVNSTALPTAACRIEAMDYKGWQAQQLTNRWVQLIVVPQNGGRLMQITFAGHSVENPLLDSRFVLRGSQAYGCDCDLVAELAKGSRQHPSALLLSLGIRFGALLDESNPLMQDLPGLRDQTVELCDLSIQQLQSLQL